MPANAPLSALERDVLDLMLKGEHPVLQALRVQRRGLSVKGRVGTGSGFLADLEVAVGTRRLAPALSTHLSDVGGEVAGVPCGFVLHVRDGLLDTLEGHVWGDADWPADPAPWSLRYLRPAVPGEPLLQASAERDVLALRLPLP